MSLMSQPLMPQSLMFLVKKTRFLFAVTLVAACGSLGKPPPGDAAEPQPAPAVVDTAEDPAPPAIDPGPQDFIGQDPAILEARIGEPSFIRTEGENRFQRYDLGACRLYVIILRGADGTRQISHIETGARNPEDPAPGFAACLQHLPGG